MGRASAMLGGLISATVAASALVVALLAAMAAPKPVWFLVGFELVVAVAGVIGLLTGAGRFRSNPALAFTCAGGTIVLASLLGSVAARGNLAAIDPEQLLVARTIAGGIMLAAGAWFTLGQRPQWSLPRLAAGVGLCAGGVGLLLGGWALRDSLGAMPALARVAAGLFGFVALTAMLSAGGHLLITAFQGPARPAEATGKA